MQKQIIAMGGGGFSMDGDNPLLDQYVLDHSHKPTPKVCFLPHATDDATRYTLNFYHAFSKLDCRPTWLSLFAPHTADLESFLLAQDVIYVGGGNTKSMIALWHEWGLDVILRKAYDAGIVLAGISAGANCWFQQCSTDSIPGPYRSLAGLGFLDDAFCPHYDGEPNRRPSLHNLLANNHILPTLACDDGAAGHFVDGQLMRIVSSRPAALGYQVHRNPDGSVSESPLPTHYLGLRG